MIQIKGYTRIKRGKIERVDPYSQAKEKKFRTASMDLEHTKLPEIKHLPVGGQKLSVERFFPSTKTYTDTGKGKLEHVKGYPDRPKSFGEPISSKKKSMELSSFKSQLRKEGRYVVLYPGSMSPNWDGSWWQASWAGGEEGFTDQIKITANKKYDGLRYCRSKATDEAYLREAKRRDIPIKGYVGYDEPKEKVNEMMNKSAKHIEGQTINELEVDGYKVWTGLPIRKRPVWAGSLKTPEEAKKEKDFEDEVMRVTGTLWNRLGKEVKYVVIEKSNSEDKMKYVILSEFDLEKSELGSVKAGHKYFKRTGVSPDYRYWYKLPSGKVINSSSPNLHSVWDKASRKETPEAKEAPKEEAPKEKKKIEGEKGDEPVIIYGGKVVSEGSGHAVEHFKQQYGKEPKEGDTVKQPGQKDYQVKEKEEEPMSEKEKAEMRERFPKDPEREARMEKLKRIILSDKGDPNAPVGFEVGKKVKVGGTTIKITDTGPKGFTGEDLETGATRRIRWEAVRGYGQGEEVKARGLRKSVEGKVIEFLVENPNPPDKKIHALSDRMKIKTPKFEAKIYGILSDIIEHGKGGNPNPRELAMGVKIEMEHTKYPELARSIALAHLKEIPDYYTRLKKMEEEAKK